MKGLTVLISPTAATSTAAADNQLGAQNKRRKRQNEMNQEKTAFLQDVLISKTIGQIDELEDLILYYRLDEFTFEQIINEIDRITDERAAGKTITPSDVLARIGIFYRPGMGSGGPTLFVSDAFKVYAPDTWAQIKNP